MILRIRLDGWKSSDLRTHFFFKTICKKAKYADLKEMEDKYKQQQSICEGYEERNIFNADESEHVSEIFQIRKMI